MLTPCVCPVAGYCETHRRRMSEGLHRACRERPGYYEAFAKSAGERPEKPAPEEPQKDRGLGDTLQRVFKAVGVDKIAKAVERATGRPCGCKERAAKLNALVPYRGDLKGG